MTFLKKITRLSFVLLLAAFVLLPSVCAADETGQREQLLKQQAYLLWQGINKIRQAPAEHLLELGISREQAVATLGEYAWVLDEGLPPLAWNEQLFSAAWGHGRDMFDRFYYAEETPEGMTVSERIPLTGYAAAAEAESLGAIVFSNYIEVQAAVGYLLDNLLRDELTVVGGEINLLSPQYTELGIGFFAESVQLIGTESYIYLAVFDFARPQQQRSFLVVHADAEHSVTVYPFRDIGWEGLQVLIPGLYQAIYPAPGGFVVARNAQGAMVGGAYLPTEFAQNYQLDLRY